MKTLLVWIFVLTVVPVDQNAVAQDCPDDCIEEVVVTAPRPVIRDENGGGHYWGDYFWGTDTSAGGIPGIPFGGNPPSLRPTIFNPAGDLAPIDTSREMCRNIGPGRMSTAEFVMIASAATACGLGGVETFSILWWSCYGAIGAAYVDACSG